MNEDTIKMIEEQLRLRTERQALREKEYNLSAKKWRARGTTLAIVALFVICGMAVCFGGMELCKLSGKILNMNTNPQPENNEKMLPFMVLCEFLSKCVKSQPEIIVPGNGLTVVSPPPQGEAVIVKAESKMIPDTWPLVVAVIVNGLIVIVGLGVATLTVKNIANYNNELE